MERGLGEWKAVSTYCNEHKRAGIMGNALKPASIWALRINRQSLSTGLSTFRVIHIFVESLRRSCNHRGPNHYTVRDGLCEDE
jgi:hypothetical protein